MNWTLLNGDSRESLRGLPDQSVSCVVTSPPYFGLRDYGNAGQIGLEPSPDEFVAALVSVFAECRRVLVDDGTLLLNLGDSYAGSWSAQSRPQGQTGEMAGRSVISARQIESHPHRTKTGTVGAEWGCKPKDLIGVPWAVAFALRADGWLLRSDIIWHKPNPMPESVQDRPTKAHEYVFLLSKSPRYYWDADAIRDPYAESSLTRLAQRTFDSQTGGPKDYALTGQNDNRSARVSLENLRDRIETYTGEATKEYGLAGVQNPSDTKRRVLESMRNGSGANARTVWTIPTEPSPYDHFAVMPKALARRCIVAACPSGGTVLDPFAGVCTTGVVALEEGRSFVGVELNPKYHAMGRERLSGVAPLLASEVSA